MCPKQFLEGHITEPTSVGQNSVVCFCAEGIKDKDKNQIGAVLKQVGVFNTRDNAYSLARHLYTEVRADWPGYRDQDKQLLKK